MMDAILQVHVHVHVVAHVWKYHSNCSTQYMSFCFGHVLKLLLLLRWAWELAPHLSSILVCHQPFTELCRCAETETLSAAERTNFVWYWKTLTPGISLEVWATERLNIVSNEESFDECGKALENVELLINYANPKEKEALLHKQRMCARQRQTSKMPEEKGYMVSCSEEIEQKIMKLI